MYQEHSYLKYEKKQTRIISPPPKVLVSGLAICSC